MKGPPSDETLLAGVAERDIGAFRALYERHAGWLALPNVVWETSGYAGLPAPLR
jgi:hypothetical protein